MSVSSDATPPAEVEIDAALVRALLRAQQPELAELPIGDRYEGWDNVTFRLGDTWAVRLPRRALGATNLAQEIDWLPRISENWTFAAPIPWVRGAPGEGFPWVWAVVPWIEGRPVYESPFHSLGARHLGRALAEIHQPIEIETPINPFRSVSLAQRAERLDCRLAVLEEKHRGHIAGGDARRIYSRGSLVPCEEFTWAHLDLHGGNVLTLNGAFAGIIDWGDAAAGDPATDLGQVLTLVGRRRFRDVVRGYADAGGAAASRSSLSEQTARRVEAEAVGYAVTLASMTDPTHGVAGWRALTDLGFADGVPDEVLESAGITNDQGAA